MAAADGVLPPAPLSRLAAAAADAMVCLWLASAWFLIAGLDALLIGHLACGTKCPVVIHAALTVILVALPSFLILGAVCALLFGKFVQPASYTNGSDKTSATQGIMDSTVMAVHIISSAAFVFLEIIGFLLSCFAVRGSRMHKVASVIVYMPPLGMGAMSCFVVLPGLAVKTWKMRPFGSASRSAEPIFSYDMEQQVAN
ncbi:unnamed protein product [Urochloa decumbens]|uniref:Uncharacterized protein n=1 Tax=Urochloa decumbens TaxID=240449 RepID=A0ABC9BUN0_9POAL